MNQILQTILIQIFCYAAVMIIPFFLMGLLLKGFLTKYFKVRASFGRLCLVKVRAVNRDYYVTGRIEEDSMLVFKNLKKEEKRLSLQSRNVFYRCLNINWIDVSEEKNAITVPSTTEKDKFNTKTKTTYKIISVDYDAVTGFDAIKYNNLYVRALTQPQVELFDFKKVVVLVLMGMGVILLAIAYLCYMNYTNSQMSLGILQGLPELIKASKGTIVGSAVVI